jgi:hypothetical protein
VRSIDLHLFLLILYRTGLLLPLLLDLIRPDRLHDDSLDRLLLGLLDFLHESIVRLPLAVNSEPFLVVHELGLLLADDFDAALMIVGPCLSAALEVPVPLALVPLRQTLLRNGGLLLFFFSM